MANSVSSHEPVFQFPWSSAVERDTREQTRQDALNAAWQGIRAREDA
jgi:hypothetical protein